MGPVHVASQEYKLTVRGRKPAYEREPHYIILAAKTTGAAAHTKALTDPPNYCTTHNYSGEKSALHFADSSAGLDDN